MFALSSDNRFHLYGQPTDMRKSFDVVSVVLFKIPLGATLLAEMYLFSSISAATKSNYCIGRGQVLCCITKGWKEALLNFLCMIHLLGVLPWTIPNWS